MEEILKEAIEKFIIPLVSTWVTPKLTNLINSTEKRIGNEALRIHHDLYKNRFEGYLSRRYEKFLVLDTLVFPNYQTLFDSLYVPVTLKTRDPSDNNEEVQILIDSFPEKLIPKYKRVLIQDTAGMGKSTVVKKLFLSCIRENKGIPILIELRKLKKDNTILNEMISQLDPINGKFDTDFLMGLIERGDFVFLFDGFDEIPLASRETVIADLEQFIEKAHHNLFLISSRPEDALVSFGDFHRFQIRELSEGEAFKLFHNYDYYSFVKIADNLISKLKEENLKSIKEFLSNPFLASLLYRSFEYKKDVPIQKSQFYAQVFDALFENHDLTKEGYFKREKYSNLHRDNFEKILRGIGYKTMKVGEVEFDKNLLLGIIEKVKDFWVVVNFNPSDYLNDLTKTVPLFRREGLTYKWAHKSLQDYFAARFIQEDTKEKQYEILIDLFFDSKNDNVLDIFYWMEPKAFRHSILRTYLEQFVGYGDSFLRKNSDLKIMPDYVGFLYNSTVEIAKNVSSSKNDKFNQEVSDRWFRKVSRYSNYQKKYYIATDVKDLKLMIFFAFKNDLSLICNNFGELLLDQNDGGLNMYYTHFQELVKEKTFVTIEDDDESIQVWLNYQKAILDLLLQKKSKAARLILSYKKCKEELFKINMEIESLNKEDFF